MNKNARKWLKALRSGKYKQGRFQLRTNDTFCCLGVACDLYMKETGKGKWVNIFAGHGIAFVDSKNEIFTAQLPLEVAKWLGLNNRYGNFVNSRNQWRSLISLNDNLNNYSFKQIANTIERSWKYLKNENG